MKRYEVIIIGAGPAGLSAAIEAACQGMRVIVFDENARPGGQLFKQIHKFFGSREHKAKIRGFRIGEMLLKEAEELGVEVMLNAAVMGIFDNKTVSVMMGGQIEHMKANDIVIATGASEKMTPFPGWTLPGVIGAGAAQTMMNIHGLQPGRKILMVGSGNVGLVVSYQLIQAGCQVAAVIDAAPAVGGYGVHAAKIARLGVPFFMSHTIKAAIGSDRVEGADIVEVDSTWQPIAGSEKHLDVDTICMAVGLSPMSQLAMMAGCEMKDHTARGGMVPVCNEYGETSIPGIYVAGDAAGIEEASSAMIQGRIAAVSISYQQGYLGEEEFQNQMRNYRNSLRQLREGMFSHENKSQPDPAATDEGCALAQNLLARGYVADSEVARFPGIPSPERRSLGMVPVIECTQNIPCDPCQDACPRGCILVGSVITSLPVLDNSATCTGCGMCVAVCPGQAIFLVDETYEPGYASLALPYEFLPLPVKGTKGQAMERSGSVLGEAEVIGIRSAKAMDETAVLTIKIPAGWSMKARFFKPYEEVCHE